MSRAFRFLLAARERLYQSGVLRIYRLSHPVVSVGNLTLGGTGKTPLVIALAEQFLKKGYRPVILSRGYRRESKGVVIVSRGEGPLVRWQDSGDEPFLIARRVPGAAVVVGADRHSAGRAAERESLGNIFILDDGFQHRGLFRDVDLVTIDPLEWAGEEKLLPRGRWREPKSAIARAHAACVQEVPGSALPQLPIPAFSVRTRCDGIYRNNDSVAPGSLDHESVTAFAGIAKPERFFTAVESMGVELKRRVTFRDHHQYTPQDLDSIAGVNRRALCITTEKDSVRLAGMGVDDFLHLRVSVTISEIDRLMSLILGRFP